MKQLLFAIDNQLGLSVVSSAVRKSLRVSLILVMLFMLGTSEAMAGASGKCGPNLRWNLDGNRLTIIGSGPMNNYSSSGMPWNPRMVERVVFQGEPTSIGNNAFNSCRINVIEIPSSVVSIGKGAFKGNKELSAVWMPEGLQSIGAEAFAKCPVLIRLTFPASVTSIGDEVCRECVSLTSVSLPRGLYKLGANAFVKCPMLIGYGSLPDFINTDNCRLYGLDETSVRKYLANPGVGSSEMTVADVADLIQQPGGNAPVKTTGNVPVKKKPTTARPVGTVADIDMNLPYNPVTDRNVFAFIFANQNYNSMGEVPFALNDGKSVETYCRQILGLPKENINVYNDATLGQMREAIAYMKDLCEVYNGDLELVIYYAGHGAPDEVSGKALLIPVDAYKPKQEVCLSMDEFNSTLASLSNKATTVFLDACFSGSQRTGDMIAECRGVGLRPKPMQLGGNVAVFSAVTDAQTAWHYDEKGHGMFTYFLLKKLRETDGKATLGEIAEYVKENVSRKSLTINRQRQTPTLTVSPALGKKWESYRLVK